MARPSQMHSAVHRHLSACGQLLTCFCVLSLPVLTVCAPVLEVANPTPQSSPVNEAGVSWPEHEITVRSTTQTSQQSSSHFLQLRSSSPQGQHGAGVSQYDNPFWRDLSIILRDLRHGRVQKALEYETFLDACCMREVLRPAGGGHFDSKCCTRLFKLVEALRVLQRAIPMRY